MNRNVLFISYHFPPDAAVGALRTQKFVKYLPDHGWKPFVLTVKEHYYAAIDEGRLKDVREAVVERTSFWRTPLQILIDLRDGFCAGKKPTSGSPSLGGGKPLRNEAACVGLKRWLVSLNRLPDDKVYWIFPALRKGLALIRAHDIRHIIVSAPPNSSILLAYLLSLLTRAKLVIDYRDPWLLSHEYSPPAFKPQRLLDLEFKLQARILRHAVAVITTNDFFRSALLDKYQFLVPDNVYVVHNGYDSSDFSSICTVIEKRLTISYLGTFYMRRTPNFFLQALSLFMHERKLTSADVKVRFVGDTEVATGSSVRELIKGYRLENVVMLEGKVSYARSLEIMCESNVLLLLAPHQPYQIPAKTYEYIAVGRPVLALTQPGATAALIESMNCGIAVDPDNVNGIKNALHQLYEDHINNARSYTCDFAFFERSNQTALLSSILERIDV